VIPDLVRRFPVLERGTGIVLADAADGGLRAFWRLGGDDLIPAVAGFVRDGAKPVVVLRLRRLHAGGATVVQEVDLRLRGAGGQGERVFSVEPHPARYDAELGLSDAAGGWVMLARSNALDHAARVDVRLSRRADPAASPQVSTETPPLAGAETAAAARPAADPAPLFPAPLPAPDALETTPGIRALDLSGEPRALHEIGVQGAVADADVARRYETPSVEPDSGAPGWTGAGAPAAAYTSAVSSAPGEDMRAPESAPRADHAGTRSPTTPMVYGQPSPRGTELLIEAELRVNGCAAPGALIDLFGHPYRVGPGGRFQLVIRVDDPELIKRAFELHPPTLPERPTDV
jgi:hypothetical protein